MASPSVLVDISRVAGLDGIAVAENHLIIGALTRHRTVERSSEVAQHVPLLSQAMPFVAHPAVRNRGTFGGSLAFADPAAELPACCVALDAQLVLVSRCGERRVPARQFFKGLYETVLRPDELLARAEIPLRKSGHRSVFLELARRRGDYAIAGIAAHGAYAQGRFTGVSAVFLGVADRPVPTPTLSFLLEGKAHSAELARGIAAAVSRDVAAQRDLYHDAAVKQHLARVLAARAVAKLAEHPECQGN